ncbi:uncharacterized protein LOC110456468 [Mizuhopecten yessoensis]|uniref:Phytanoyl-CoA dioxygenase n=1 Tax=Mizuhopecten yessoensis TaxID=6573 RepID=A0A210QAV0_MIZYE|nr:uncharacterized protein LOC110456468 [Mizuhopecten yessoensis]OWF45861.1 hypothetical protein KP79_PYT07259 [Mizuhopecten yessoensis]
MEVTQYPRTVELGTRVVTFPSPELQELKDSNHLLGNTQALRDQLQQQGYLFIRGFHDRKEVLEAREAVIRHVVSGGDGKIQEPATKGVLGARCGIGCIPFMEGKNDITHAKEVIRVLEGPRPKKFFNELFGSDCATFDYKWLRGIHRRAFTGAHVDNVYMGRGSQSLVTLWTPFGDVSVEMGTLCMCEGSHKLDSFKRFQETYGNLDVEAANLKGSGWFTSDPDEISAGFGGQWKTTDFRAGDVLLFTMRTVHMSTSNLTDFLRISCDTRWQPACDQLDTRFMGQFEVESGAKFGLNAEGDKISNSVTIEMLRKEWGI